MTQQLLRTASDGCWQLLSNSWGQFLAPTADPDANVVLTEEQLQGFELHDDIVKMPAALWQRWIQLCMHFSTGSMRELEVSCRLLRKEGDKSQWRVVVPPQAVGGASVRADSFDGAIDIETGEVIEHWPPDGWLPCGSSHSHNTMDAFFSPTDNDYELGDPGLHIVVGRIDTKARTYTLKASVTACRRRFIIDHSQVIETEPVKGASFHLDVLKIVNTHDPFDFTTGIDITGKRQSRKFSRLRTPSQMNAGNGYSDGLHSADAFWDDPLPIRSANDPDAIDSTPITEAITKIINDAIFNGREEYIRNFLYDIEDHVEMLREDLISMTLATTEHV